MKIAIIGANGMLSVAFTKYFFCKADTQVAVYGIEEPQGYQCDVFKSINLVSSQLDYEELTQYDTIIYASGAGVQAALKTPSELMYQLNVMAPISLTLGLKKAGYQGVYVSFGSYMEIGLNDDDSKSFTEEKVVCSTLPVTNDYGLSKRLYGRYMKDFHANYHYYHFILPNMFSEDDLRPGTRLVPYTLQYLQNYKAGKNPAPPSFSAGLQTRQYITLEEMIQTVDKTIELQIPSGIYNIGGGEFLSIRELIERLFIIYGVPCKNEFFGKEVRRDGDIKSLRIDGTKLKSFIHQLPSAKIEEIFSI